MAAIELLGLAKRFGQTVAVDGLDLSVADGEFFCIFGPPTSGKTTILRLILGLEVPDAGRVMIGGRDVTDASPGARDVAMVFQNLALFPHLTAGDNIRFPLVERKRPAAEIATRVAAVADKLHIGRLLDKLPAHLSGGERQRVAIARALVRDPAAYLMDDPIAALDARLREETRVELKRLQRELGKTLVYVTHDQEEAMSVADRMAILEAGAVRQVGSPDDIYNRPASAYVAAMVGAPRINLVRGRARDGRFASDDGRVRLPLPAWMAGRSGEVELGIRPEDIRLGNVGADAAVGATIDDVEPLGGHSVVDLVTADGLPLRAAVRGQPRLAAGEAVGLAIDPSRLHVFDAASGASLAPAA